MGTKKIKRIAVMTGGGDCPGLNAVIRAVTKTAITKYKLEVLGIEDGYLGLIEDRKRVLDYTDVSNILTIGGTILGSCNRSNPSRYPVETSTGKIMYRDISGKCIKRLADWGVDALICIGGDGTMASAAKFAKLGVTVMGVPKTIDNDLPVTDFTFGFDTAVTTATEAIDKVHTTAGSHHRVMIVEIMGRYAGWLTLYSGVASGSDIILIPEIPYNIDKVREAVLKRSKKGKGYSIIAVAEGAKPKGGKMVIAKKIATSPDPIRLGGIANMLAEQIPDGNDIDCRAVVLGHVQRGGTPTPHDRTLATLYGHTAIELLMKGTKNHLVVFKDGKLSSVPLARIAGKIKTVPKNHPLIRAAKAVGTSFGV
jgi:phosphofructokinase-like protein